MLRIIRPIREQIFLFATSPSSDLAATFSHMEKEKFAQSRRLLLTSKNQRTSIRCDTEPKTLAQLGEGGPAALVGEGQYKGCSVH